MLFNIIVDKSLYPCVLSTLTTCLIYNKIKTPSAFLNNNKNNKITINGLSNALDTKQNTFIRHVDTFQ